MEKYRTTKEKKPLTLEDMVAAESILIQFSQRQQYREDIKALQKGKQVSRTSQLLKLDQILQDGTLRVGGRLNKSAMPENVNHPAVLSKHCRVATLILRDIHQKTGQCERSYVMAQLRSKYWIPQANSDFRKIINKCAVCRRISGRVGEQKMANLPEDRICRNTDVDFFGPFDVKWGRSTVKRYGYCSLALPLEPCTSKLQIASIQIPALTLSGVLYLEEVKLLSCALTTAHLRWR